MHACNAIPILVVSATFSGNDAELRTLELGASGFLPAPFAPSALQDYARALLSGRRPEPAPQVVIAHPDPLEADRLRVAFQQAGYEVELRSHGAGGGGDMARPAAGGRDRRPASAGWIGRRGRGRGQRPRVADGRDHDRRDASTGEALTFTRHGADATVFAPAEPARLIELVATARRQRSLMRIEELLDERTRSLRDSEARWRSLIEAIPEIVVVHDVDGTIRHVNRIGAEHLGWQADELVGLDLRELERAVLRSDDPDGTFEAVWMTRDGREVPVEVARRHLRFGGREGLLSVARDVGARQELARQRQDFLAMLTHDIKNPLGIVRGFAELLGEVGPLNTEQKDLVARIQTNADTVLTLVANYLTLTQIETGQLAVARKPVDLAALIDAVAHQFRDPADRAGVAYETAIDDPLGVIAADPVALERALTNVLRNAVTFTPAGGRVAISARRGAGRITVEVSDTGVGIPSEELGSVFQLAGRGLSRRENQGTGLGLFIARALVTAHGGSIAIDSAPGSGTTVVIDLPTGATIDEHRAGA